MCLECFPESPAVEIRVHVNDSCNCCYGKNRDKKSTTEMYINSHGIAVKFDEKKTDDAELSRTQSYSHLNEIIDHNVSVSSKTKKEFESYLADELLIDLNVEYPAMITLTLIERVNTAIKDIFDS